MYKIVKSIITVSIFVIAANSFAQNSGFKDSQGNTLMVDTPIEFYISTETIPQDKWESIDKAIAQANQEIGAERIQIGGIYIGPKEKQDNVNSITFSNDFHEDQLNVRSKQSNYWSGGKINEVDVIVNTKSFDYSQDQSELVLTLKTQFKKIFGQ